MTAPLLIGVLSATMPLKIKVSMMSSFCKVLPSFSLTYLKNNQFILPVNSWNLKYRLEESIGSEFNKITLWLYDLEGKQVCERTLWNVGSINYHFGAFDVLKSRPHVEDDVIVAKISDKSIMLKVADLLQNDWDPKSIPLKGIFISKIGKQFHSSFANKLLGANDSIEIHKLEGAKKSPLLLTYSAVNNNGLHSNNAHVTIRLESEPNDPFLTKQWHLWQTGLIDVLPLYNGSGVNVAVMDGGLPQLYSELNQLEVRAGYSLTYGGKGSTLTHGIEVSGLMFASSNNSYGAVGIASGAKAIFYQDGLSNRHYNDYASHDVINLSLGFDSLHPENNLSRDHDANVQQIIHQGRNGKGIVVVYANGNSERDRQYSSPDSPSVIYVGSSEEVPEFVSVDHLRNSHFSTLSPRVLIAAPGENVMAPSCHEITVQPDGSLKCFETIDRVSGTSFSAPIASATAALMLEANPKLTLLDVKKILSLSGNNQLKSNSSDAFFNPNPFINYKGSIYSHETGFGDLNGKLAVNYAESWLYSQGFEDYVQYMGPRSIMLSTEIGDLNAKQDMCMSYYEESSGYIDNLVLTLTDVNAKNIEKLNLISPKNTAAVLLRANKNTGVYNVTHENWSFVVEAFRGQKWDGEWRLCGQSNNNDSQFQVDGWRIEFNGRVESPREIFINDDILTLENQFDFSVFENGPETLNLVGLSRDVGVALQMYKFNVGQQEFPIPYSIANIVCGNGADKIFGNGADNLIIPGRGNDTMVLGAGKDVVLYPNTRCIIKESDIIADYEPGQDRVVIRDQNEEKLNIVQASEQEVMLYFSGNDCWELSLRSEGRVLLAEQVDVQFE